jgi:signal transduction histidine kinase
MAVNMHMRSRAGAPPPTGYWAARLLERQEAERALRDDYVELREAVARQAAELRAVRAAINAAAVSVPGAREEAEGQALAEAAERLDRHETQLAQRTEALGTEITETRPVRERLESQAADIRALREAVSRVCASAAAVAPAEIAAAVEAARGDLDGWARRRVDELIGAAIEVRAGDVVERRVTDAVERRLAERLPGQLAAQATDGARDEARLRETLERDLRAHVAELLREGLEAERTLREERRARREKELDEQLARRLQIRLEGELRVRVEEHRARTGAEMAVRLAEAARSARAEIAREREALGAGFETRVETALAQVRTEYQKAADDMRARLERRDADVEALRAELEREIAERGRAHRALGATLEQENRGRTRGIADLAAAQAALEARLAASAPASDPALAAEIARVAEQLRRERGARRRLAAAVRDLVARAAARPGEPAGVVAPGSNPSPDRRRARSRLVAAIRRAVRIHADRVAGVADLLLDTGLTPGQRRWLGVIKGSAAAILEALGCRTAAEDRRPRPAPFAVWDGVRDVLEPLGARARARGVRLSCHMATDVPEVLVGDGPGLLHVLTNVVENAVRFTDAGEVTVSIGLASRTPARVVLLVGVSDSGCGIPAPQQRRLFALLASERELGRRRPEARGLGLPVAASVVRAMGGRFWFESEPDHGSSVRFTVPLDVGGEDEAHREDPEGRAAPRPARTASPRAGRVLLAEPDPASRLETARALEELGYDVVAVEDGQQAIAAVANRRLDAAVLTLRMPRLDAFETAAGIWTRAEDVAARLPIVAVGVRVSPSDRERARAAGIDAVVERTQGARAVADALGAVMGTRGLSIGAA